MWPQSSNYLQIIVMASQNSLEETEFDEMLVAVALNITRSDCWSKIMALVHDVMTADYKTYKQGAFSLVIQLDDSTPEILSAYLKSPLVSEVEKAIFLDIIETLTTYSLEYEIGKLIGFLNNKLFKNLIEPDVYVPRSLITRRIYLVDLYEGNISDKNYKSLSSY